jgi:hypothetical protein
MASEDTVSYTIMTALRNNQWNILHYHPPGGQAAWGIFIAGELIFLDILAYKNGKVVLAENKGRFNIGDIEKLRRLMHDESAVEQVRAFIESQCIAWGIDWDNHLQFYLVHGYSGKAADIPLSDVNLAHVSDSGVLTLLPSQLNPLEI